MITHSLVFVILSWIDIHVPSLSVYSRIDYSWFKSIFNLYLLSLHITVTQFQYILIILLHGDLRQNKQGLSYVHLHISQCGWVLILTSSMLQQRFKLQISLDYDNIEQNAFSWLVVDGHVSFNLVGVHIILLLPCSINNDITLHAWLDKDHILQGMPMFEGVASHGW